MDYYDIAVIAEIKRDDKWEYVPEIPLSLSKYEQPDTYKFLGLDYNKTLKKTGIPYGFKPKGLPEDMSGLQFRLEPDVDLITKEFKKATDASRKVNVAELPDGTLYECGDVRIDEFTKKNPGVAIDIYTTHFLTCYTSFTKFLEAAHANGYCDYDEKAQAYGYWMADFTHEHCCDHSWLTLAEMLDADYDAYIAKCFEQDKATKKITPPTTDVVRDYVFNQPANLSFQELKEKHVDLLMQLPVIKGVKGLQNMAAKHQVSPDGLRIVFAFYV